jgi:hypothetical protein
MPAAKQTTSANVVDLQVAVGVLQSQVLEVKRGQDRIENKIDSMSNVTRTEFEKFQDSVSATYVTKEDIKPIKNIVYGVIGAMLTAFVTGGIYILLRIRT